MCEAHGRARFAALLAPHVAPSFSRLFMGRGAGRADARHAHYRGRVQLLVVAGWCRGVRFRIARRDGARRRSRRRQRRAVHELSGAASGASAIGECCERAGAHQPEDRAPLLSVRRRRRRYEVRRSRAAGRSIRPKNGGVELLGDDDVRVWSRSHRVFRIDRAHR